MTSLFEPTGRPQRSELAIHTELFDGEAPADGRSFVWESLSSVTEQLDPGPSITQYNQWPHPAKQGRVSAGVVIKFEVRHGDGEA